MDAERVGSVGGEPDRVLNGGLLQSLVEDIGRDDVRALVDLFLDDAPARIAALRAAIEGGDATAAAKVAHLMKSSASSVGALAYAARCGQLEQLAGEQRLEAARAGAEALPAALAATASALADALSGRAPTGGP